MTTASDRQRDVARQYLNCSLDATGLLAAVDVALSATGFESASVVIADDTIEYIVAQRGRTSTFPAVSPRAGTLSNESMRVGRAIIINDIDVHNRADRIAANRFGNHVAAAGARSCVAIPLRGIDHHVIGVLQVLSPEPGVASSAAVDILRRCGAIVEILLECRRHTPRLGVHSSVEVDVDRHITNPGRPVALINLYQPIVNLASRDVTAVHLWAAPELPTGHAHDLDMTALTQGVADLRGWRHLVPALKLSVELSRETIALPGTAQLIRQIVADADVPPCAVILQISDTGDHTSANYGSASVQELRAMNFMVHLKATGDSGLFPLTRVRVDGLNIGGPLVSQLGTRTADAIVSGIAGIVRTLTISLVAADIATTCQESLARKLGATHGWGSLWGSASPADDVPDRLAALAITAASARQAAIEAATGMLAQFHRCTTIEAASVLTLRAVLAATSTSDMATRLVDGREPLSDL